MLFENRIAERRAAQNQAATYLYRFDWRSRFKQAGTTPAHHGNPLRVR